MVAISGTISYCPNPAGTGVASVTMTLTGTTTTSTVTDAAGNYTFTALPSGGNYVITPSKAPRPPASAGINTVDAVACQRDFLHQAPPLTGCKALAGDVNGDGRINTSDIVAIQRFLLGAPNGTANVGQYRFTPANRTYNGVTTDQTAQNYDSYVLGDVASGFVQRPEGSPPDVAEGDSGDDDGTPQIVKVGLPNIAVDVTATSFAANVVTTNIDRASNLVGFQGDITFDSTVVSFESEPVGQAGLTSGNWNVTGSILDGPGPIRTLRVSAISNDFEPLLGSGALFQLRFVRLGKPSQLTQLFWDTASDHFYFIDADLKTHKPVFTAPGSITPVWNDKAQPQPFDSSNVPVAPDESMPNEPEEATDEQDSASE